MSDLGDSMDQPIDEEGKTIQLSQPLGDRSEPRQKPRRVHVIINPAAGQDQPVLKILNAAFKTADVDWEASITKEAGDACRAAQQAASSDFDAVLVYGGDGTVMEAASGLIGSDVPLGIIPGGTANVMSVELGIPINPAEACALAVNPQAAVRKVDMGQVGDHYFLLRASLGFEAVMVEGADRDLKDRLGVLAYAFSAFLALADPPVARYRLTLDGELVETQGLACIVANSGALRTPRFLLMPDIDVSDGLLDVIVITRSDLPSLVALAASVVSGGEKRPAMQHWQVRNVVIEADPPQVLQVDGEIATIDTIDVHVLPQAVKIIVPPPVEQA